MSVCNRQSCDLAEEKNIISLLLRGTTTTEKAESTTYHSWQEGNCAMKRKRFCLRTWEILFHSILVIFPFSVHPLIKPYSSPLPTPRLFPSWLHKITHLPPPTVPPHPIATQSRPDPSVSFFSLSLFFLFFLPRN